jgi:hypothetical protein
MIPMVSSVAELRSVREQLGALGTKLTLGVMVETPAAALIADRLAAEADFLSIGSNDLAQYALAMDRTNPLLAGSIDALHPAVLRLIAMTAEAGQRSGKPISLCGNLASEPLELGHGRLVPLRIADLRPVDEVAAVEDRHPWKPGEGRIDEIIIAADANDARVRVEPLQDRIRILARARLRQSVVAAIFEPVELRRSLPREACHGRRNEQRECCDPLKHG